MNHSLPPGVFDIIPFDSKDRWKSSSLWSQVEAIMRNLALSYNYRELRTPIFEKTELFQKGVGEETDIVGKEMYTFIDKGERSLTLRPEGTASVVRAFIENNLDQLPNQKFFYIGPYFRYERAQKGRFRQFHQFGIEAYGSEKAEQDIEIIDLAFSLYQKLGLKGLKVYINSIGYPEARAKYREALISYFKGVKDKLSPESQVRLEKNPLRILDSKDEGDKIFVKDAPIILDYLSSEDKIHFEQVQEGLRNLNIPFEVNPQLVRGLDYYNRTVFEIVSSDLGSQNSLCGGGRYDGLLKSLGGKDLPSSGFATGIERILQVMCTQNANLSLNLGPLLYLIPMGEKATTFCMKMAHDLRQEGISTEVDFDAKKVGKAIGRASSMNATYIAVIGEEELNSQMVELKKLSNQEKSKLPFPTLVKVLKLEAENEMLLEKYSDLFTPFSSQAESQFFLSKVEYQIESAKKVASDLEKALKSFQNSLNS